MSRIDGNLRIGKIFARTLSMFSVEADGSVVAVMNNEKQLCGQDGRGSAEETRE